MTKIYPETRAVDIFANIDFAPFFLQTYARKFNFTAAFLLGDLVFAYSMRIQLSYSYSLGQKMFSVELQRRHSTCRDSESSSDLSQRIQVENVKRPRSDLFDTFVPPAQPRVLPGPTRVPRRTIPSERTRTLCRRGRPSLRSRTGVAFAPRSRKCPDTRQCKD